MTDVALIDAIVYADAFDCAATIDEIHRFSRLEIDREALIGELDALVGARQLVRRGDAYSLPGREVALARIAAESARTTRLLTRAHRAAVALRHVPFVRGIALTGSVAAGHPPADADVDLLVIVEPGRIATVFLALGSSSTLTRRRLFCPNYYLAADALELGPGDVYLAREVAQAVPLAGLAGLLRAANPWVERIFPNLASDGPAPREERSRTQRAAERVLAGRRGEALERRAATLARRRLVAHHRQEGGVPDPSVLADLEKGTALRFHAGSAERRARERYRALRLQTADQFAGVSA